MSNDVIDIGGAAAPTPEKFIVSGTDGQRYNTRSLHEGLAKLVAAQKMVLKNPTDAGAAWKLINDGRMQIGMFQQKMPTALHPILRPLVQAANGPMLEAAREAVRLRMRQSNELMKNPTQSIPLTLDASTFVPATAATFVVQNPYIGSGGAIYNSQGIWAVTAIETGALQYNAGIVFGSAIFAGHDYVSASFGGIQSTTGLGASAGTYVVATGVATGEVRGWPLSMFASDKRFRDHTTFSPWNLQGAGGIIGSIMRETGTVTLGIVNNANVAFPLDLAGGGTGYSGTVNVHVKASLCGSPFNPDLVHRMFVPFNRQLMASHRLATGLPSHFAPMFESLSQAQQQISGLENNLEDIRPIDY